MKKRNIGKTNEVLPLHLKAALSTRHVARFLPSVRGRRSQEIGRLGLSGFFSPPCCLYLLLYLQERGTVSLRSHQLGNAVFSYCLNSSSFKSCSKYHLYHQSWNASRDLTLSIPCCSFYTQDKKKCQEGPVTCPGSHC